MTSILVRAAALAGALLLGGCVQLPVIESAKLAPVKTVAVVDIPPMRHVAWLGVYISELSHFRPSQDMFFLNSAAGTPAMHTGGVAAGINAGLTTPGVAPGAGLGVGLAVGALIDLSAQDTIAKSQSYHDDVMKRVPGTDLRADFMGSLLSALKAKGYDVRVIDDNPARSPRLRWPTDKGSDFVRAIPTDAAAAHPPVDADVVLQVSPVAMHMAPGGLNAYDAKVSVAVALYNGRTKEFLGMQIIKADTGRSPSYHRYSALLDDSPKVVADFRAALLSLVPQVAAALPPARR